MHLLAQERQPWGDCHEEKAQNAGNGQKGQNGPKRGVKNAKTRDSKGNSQCQCLSRLLGDQASSVNGGKRSSDSFLVQKQGKLSKRLIFSRLPVPNPPPPPLWTPSVQALPIKGKPL